MQNPLEYACGVATATAHLAILAAGGMNAQNVADYVTTGVDALVTISRHHTPPVDIGVQVIPA